MNRRVWVIFALFLLLRLVLAFRLPIFNDESIYMHWGLGFLQNPGHWWAWTLDGKQPLVAISFGTAQLLPIDPLISMRLVSILWSCITFWSVYLLLSRMSFPRRRESPDGIKMDPRVLRPEDDKRSALFSRLPITDYGLLLIAFCPFLILFDTLALAESPITACFTLTLYLSLLFSAKPALWKALALGAVVALGWWYKSTMLLTVPLIFLTLLINWKQWIGKWHEALGWLIIGALVAFAFMVPVLFNPNFDYTKTTTAIIRTKTIAQIVTTPLAQWLNNGRAIVEWFIAFAGPLTIIVVCIALWQFRKKREVQLLAVWVFGPVLIVYALLTSLTARYIVATSVPLLMVAAYWISNQKNTIVRYGSIVSVAIAGVLLSVAPLSFYRVLQPLPAAQLDFGQYVMSWQSGWGISEAVAYLARESVKQPIVVFVRLDSGNPEDAVLSYMTRAHIPVFYLDEIKQVLNYGVLNNRPWYFVSRGNQYGGLEKYMTLLTKFKKPLDDEFVGVYRINR